MKNEQRDSLNSIYQTLENYEGFGLYNSIKPLQNPTEHRQLIHTVNDRKPETILEIGTANGGSLYPWCRYIDGVNRVIAVDINFWGRDPDFYNTFVSETGRKFDSYMGNSHSEELLKQIAQDLDTKMDFLFIDGDHSYEGVKKDFQLYSKLVSSGGLVAFHDIRGDHERCGVGTLWNELKSDHSTQEFHDSNGPDEWGGIGVLTLE
ncbi:class I SAM-dependent methyltransferase [Halovenus marina]|uniref:class I SAM-dependent methyltransferase n=1 Tax=Halovenus marina TaxID=3396621 RepID=UPI003F569246